MNKKHDNKDCDLSEMVCVSAHFGVPAGDQFLKDFRDLLARKDLNAVCIATVTAPPRPAMTK